jgi:hypothetical protein
MRKESHTRYQYTFFVAHSCWHSSVPGNSMIVRQIGIHLSWTREILTSIIQSNAQLYLEYSGSDSAPREVITYHTRLTYLSWGVSFVSVVGVVSLTELTGLHGVTQGGVYVHRVWVGCNSKWVNLLLVPGVNLSYKQRSYYTYMSMGIWVCKYKYTYYGWYRLFWQNGWRVYSVPEHFCIFTFCPGMCCSFTFYPWTIDPLSQSVWVITHPLQPINIYRS